MILQLNIPSSSALSLIVHAQPMCRDTGSDEQHEMYDQHQSQEHVCCNLLPPELVYQRIAFLAAP